MKGADLFPGGVRGTGALEGARVTENKKGGGSLTKKKGGARSHKCGV